MNPENSEVIFSKFQRILKKLIDLIGQQSRDKQMAHSSAKISEDKI